MSAWHTLLADIKIDPKDIGINDPVTNADAALSTALNSVYMVAGIIAVVVIIIAGYMYATSGGEAASVKRAKEMIIGAVVGLVVIIMAFVITQFVLGRF